ncbi:MAG: tRNA lysidine(34) synthetase TilS [Alphaproteobacteria bacterium]|nr:MAG: tRNA lysidine(34) synthetase TilS [Alphaproteobacteria bacterium]
MSAASEAPVSASEAAALFADLSDAPVLILAVSGGPDSTALLWLAARWRAKRKRGPRLIAVTIDHGLRQASTREALAVKRLAKKLNVAHRTLRWAGKKPNTGIQEAARAARYRLLGDAARRAGAGHILTAHTLDDQAETVLFRLARGSGLSGLRGMVPRAPLPSPERGGSIAAGDRGGVNFSQRTPTRRASLADLPLAGGGGALLLLRPFLTLPKSRLLATLRAAKVPFADDPSNRDPRFTRPRLRELMPGLAAEGLDARRLAGFARRMARADQAIEHAVEEAAAGLSRGAGPLVFSRQYADLPAEIALRLLGRAIAQVGNEGPVELAKLEALYDALAAAMAQKSPDARFRRTLAGALVTFAGEITVERAPARRSAAPTGPKRRKGAFTKAR